MDTGVHPALRPGLEALLGRKSARYKSANVSCMIFKNLFNVMELRKTNFLAWTFIYDFSTK